MSSGPCRHKFVHILVAEGMLGRPLRKDEHVHHKDGQTQNCHWTNLIVLKDDTHNAVSNRQYWYLKQKFAREDAAWKAFFDVTGQSYDDYEVARMGEELGVAEALIALDEKGPIN